MIDVLYLARGTGNSFEEIEHFFASYHAHPAGCEHNLHIIAKGFEENPQNYAKLQTLSKNAKANIIDLPDDGYDFMAYARASQKLSERFIFCLNTSSVILYDNWLQYFEYHTNKNPKLGMVGAFGSWESLPNLRKFMDNEITPADRTAYWKKYKHVFTNKRLYSFPNPHIRTNGVLMDRQVYLNHMQDKCIKYKFECYNLEGGSENISRHFTGLGYEIGVINCEGEFFYPDRWDLSYTFGCLDSDKGLFSDRQHRRVEALCFQDKLQHSFKVWGYLHYKNKHPHISIFSIYHDRPTMQLDAGSLYLHSNVYRPIFTGNSPLEKREYFFDDKKGDHISEKNPFFGELTAHYWVWKNFIDQNPENKYIGFAHYRRVLNLSESDQNTDEFLQTYIYTYPPELYMEFGKQHYKTETFNKLNAYDMVLVNPHYTKTSVEDFFALMHPKEYMDIFKEILIEFHPDYSEEMTEILTNNKMYLSTIFVMKKELFKEFCEWIFPMLFELEKRADLSVHAGTYQARIPAFLHERFFNIWLCKKMKKEPLNILETSCFLYK